MDPIDRVFGRNRLQMVTGAHVEVFREAAAHGESRRYTKRFLTTADGDYAAWTEREWRILARLIGHGTRCVPDVVQYDRGATGTKLVQTYDAGATVDQWATLLPVVRDGHVHAHVFEDCAHWWALAHHCLVALDEIHTLELVHLDVKGDNICIPVAPADFDPQATNGPMFPLFRKLALIDFAFSLVSGETLANPLPIGWQQDYDYQSPRLLRALELGRAGDLQPTEALDWRCDMYSLAAMLKRYLPGEHRLFGPAPANGWTAERFHAARSLVFRIREAHDEALTSRRPHSELIERTSTQLGAPDLASSLERGWALARDTPLPAAQSLPLTPITRLAPSIRLVIPARDEEVAVPVPAVARRERSSSNEVARGSGALRLLAAAACVVALVGVVPLFVDIDAVVQRATAAAIEGGQAMSAALRALLPRDDAAESPATPPSLAAPGNDAKMPATASEPIDLRASGNAIHDRPVATESTGQPQLVSDTTSSTGANPSPAESPRTEPQSSSPPALRTPIDDSPAKPAASAASAESSAAARAESSRGRPAQRLAGARPRLRAESTGTAEATRRGQLARTNKAPSTANAVPPRTQAALAPRRMNGAPMLAASQLPPRSSPGAVVPSPRTQPSSRGAQPSATPLAPEASSATVVRASPELATTGTAAATGTSLAIRPSGTTEPRTDVPLPVPASAAVTWPIAPPVDIPRPLSVPTAPANHANAAPIVEPPRTYVVPGGKVLGDVAGAPPGGAHREAPRMLNAPTISPPRTIASSPPPGMRTESSLAEDDPDDAHYLDQGRRMVSSVVPRTAARVYAQMTRVLAVAANAHLHVQEREVSDAFLAAGVAVDLPFPTRESSARVARRLHDAARHAYGTRRHVPEALELELTAFGADPSDAEIAGTLAFLHLKIVPAQPERARQLALHAIGLRSARYPTGRQDDWTTFSIASALAGRSGDATNVLLASLALTRNLDRSCRSAWAALASHGERMREPVESLMSRLYAQGRDDDSPYCLQRTTRSAWSRY